MACPLPASVTRGYGSTAPSGPPVPIGSVARRHPPYKTQPLGSVGRSRPVEVDSGKHLRAIRVFLTGWLPVGDALCKEN
jgi:hypothetical protein